MLSLLRRESCHLLRRICPGTAQALPSRTTRLLSSRPYFSASPSPRLWPSSRPLLLASPFLQPHRHFASPQKPKKQKLKTHKGLAKRIIVTARGFKYKSPNHHHMNTGKRYNRLLRLRKKKIVHEKFKIKIIKKLLPYHAKQG